MKRLKRVLALILIVSCLLTAGAYAAAIPGEGLAVFEEVARMTPTTFSDLGSTHWGYYGIKVSYDRGLLVGDAEGTFRPEGTVTWAEAIAVASRIHSAYYANALNMNRRDDEAWYMPYLRYSVPHKLLPPTRPADDKLAEVVINRYDIAYMFARTVDAEDMPQISTLAITDEAVIPAYCKSDVKRLYSAGILVGMLDNSFAGERNATRAEIAGVIARIILPAERVGHDSKVNTDMADYEANLENDSISVQIGKTYYSIYKHYETVDTVSYKVFESDDNGNARAIYTAPVGSYIDNISLYNGKVYFARSTSGSANGSLMCYDPASKTLSTVYSGYIIESYCFYDGKLYALAFTQYADKPNGYVYAFGQISGGSFEPFWSDLKYAEVANFVPYGWNGKLYFKLAENITVKDAKGERQVSVDKLWSYDPVTSSTEKVADYNINTSFYDGHVMYFMAYDSEGNYDLNLYAISLQTPGVVKTVGAFPAPTNVRNRTIYKYGDKFYCLSSFNRNLYSMNRSGEARLALMCGGVYNSINFTADKMVLIPNTLVTSNANELKTYNARSLSNRALYGDWLGQSVYYEGARFVPENGQSVYESTDSVSTVSNLPITVTKAFMRGNDFVLQTKYTNNFENDIKLRSYIVRVYNGSQLVAYDLNRMSGYEMKSHAIRTFTFVIAGADVLQQFDLKSTDLRIEVIPTYDIVPEAQKP